MSTKPGTGQPVDARIRVLRGHRVMLDADLAALYGVSVSALNQAVKRNPGRFPPDFMFPLEEQEVANLKSQTVTSSSVRRSWGGRRSAPNAFTEQGVAMLSSVLRSERAVRVNVEIMRAFVRLRELAGHNKELARRIDALESKYDRQFKVVFDAIRELMMPPAPARKRSIGFISGE
jgi:ORF6N domain